MRTIDIIIKGTVYYCDCFSQAEKNEDDSIDWDFVESRLLIEPDSVEAEGIVYERIDEDDEDTWQEKCNNFWSLAMDGYDFPFEMWVSDYQETLVYKLQLEDDEKFDIHKLTFIVSYEFMVLEDAGLFKPIMYGDKQLEMEPEENDNHVAEALGSAHACVYEFNEYNLLVKPEDEDYMELPYAK